MPSLRQGLWRLHTKLATREHRLLYLFLELTRRCNLSCRHCGSDCGRDVSGSTLSLESWLSVIDHASYAFGPELCFVLTGGEPLLYPYITELATRLGSSRHRWGLVTNGCLLSPEMLARLVDSRIYSITVSLDGLEATHTWLRRDPKAYELALKAIRAVGASSIPVRDVVTSLFPRNLAELDSLAEVLLGTGVGSWRLCRIFAKGRAAGSETLLLDRAGVWRAIEWVAANRPRLLGQGPHVQLGCEGWLPLAWDLRVRESPYFCRSGINIASVLRDGSVTGCPNNSAYLRQGSIAEQGLAQLWDREFSVYRNRSWMRRGACAACPDWKDCRGGPIHLWEQDGVGPEMCYVRDV